MISILTYTCAQRSPPRLAFGFIIENYAICPSSDAGPGHPHASESHNILWTGVQKGPR